MGNMKREKVYPYLPPPYQSVHEDARVLGTWSVEMKVMSHSSNMLHYNTSLSVQGGWLR